MRILYLSQYFPPEIGATQNRSFEIAANLVRLGHHVTVITEIPNHPSGIIPPKYRRKLIIREDLDGIDVIRVWVKTATEKNFSNRMLFYLSYMINSFLAGIFISRSSFDILYATSPPLFVGASGIALSFIRRIPLIFEVRDLWPESAIALGELSNHRAIRLATRLEQACYRHAQVIVVVTKGIYNNLVSREIPAQKIVIVPNGSNVEHFQYNSLERQRLRNELGFTEKFIVLYAGIHGIAQGLEVIIEAANILKTYQNIWFVMIGEGPRKRDLIRLADSYDLDNVIFLNEQTREAIPGFLSAADIALIPLRKIDLFEGVLPSKLFDAWACQRPVILSVDGEARSILEDAQAGLFVVPEDPGSLSEAILNMQDDPIGRQRMGKNGRDYTVKHYSRKVLSEKLADILQGCIER